MPAFVRLSIFPLFYFNISKASNSPEGSFADNAHGQTFARTGGFYNVPEGNGHLSSVSSSPNKQLLSSNVNNIDKLYNNQFQSPSEFLDELLSHCTVHRSSSDNNGKFHRKTLGNTIQIQQRSPAETNINEVLPDNTAESSRSPRYNYDQLHFDSSPQISTITLNHFENLIENELSTERKKSANSVMRDVLLQLKLKENSVIPFKTLLTFSEWILIVDNTLIEPSENIQWCLTKAFSLGYNHLAANKHPVHEPSSEFNLEKLINYLDYPYSDNDAFEKKMRLKQWKYQTARTCYEWAGIENQSQYDIYRKEVFLKVYCRYKQLFNSYNHLASKYYPGRGETSKFTREDVLNLLNFGHYDIDPFRKMMRITQWRSKTKQVESYLTDYEEYLKLFDDQGFYDSSLQPTEAKSAAKIGSENNHSASIFRHQ